MFKELMPVIQDRPVTITVVVLKAGQIKICVVPQSQEKDGKANKKVTSQTTEVAKIPEAAIRALTTPLAITGTPEELDANLPEALTKYAQDHAKLQHGIEQATQEIHDGVKALEERREAQVKSQTKKTTTSQQKESTANSTGASESDPGTGKTEEPKASTDVSGTLPLSWCAPSAASESAAGKPSNNNGVG